MDEAQIEALHEAKLAFDRAVAIFEGGSRDSADDCRTRAAMTLITLGIGELGAIWPERSVRTAVARLVDRVYATAKA
jgi:hypothetical protein